MKSSCSCSSESAVRVQSSTTAVSHLRDIDIFHLPEASLRAFVPDDCLNAFITSSNSSPNQEQNNVCTTNLPDDNLILVCLARNKSLKHEVVVVAKDKS